MSTKICSKCKIEKFIDEFRVDNSKKDGHKSQCKRCEKEAYLIRSNSFEALTSADIRFIRNKFGNMVLWFELDTFRDMLKNYTNYMDIYNIYKEKSFPPMLRPAVIIIDISKPILPDNIKVVHHKDRTKFKSSGLMKTYSLHKEEGILENLYDNLYLDFTYSNLKKRDFIWDLDKEIFIKYFLGNTKFKALFHKYKNAKKSYDKQLIPIILRRDIDDHYTLKNLMVIRWQDIKPNVVEYLRRFRIDGKVLCNKCKGYYPQNMFNKSITRNGERLQGFCINCKKDNQIAELAKAEKFANVMYNNMLSRCKKRNHPMPKFSKEWFIKWIMKKEEFIQMHTVWANNDFDTELAPSIHRIDEDETYSKDNILLMTWGEHKSLEMKPVGEFSKDGKLLKTYESLSKASDETGISKTQISRCCNGKIDDTHGRRFMFIDRH